MPRNQTVFEIDGRRVLRQIKRRIKEGRVKLSENNDPPIENGTVFDWERPNWLRIGAPAIISLPFLGLWLSFPFISIFLYAAILCIVPSILSLWSKRTTKVMFHLENSEHFETLPDKPSKLFGNRALSPEEEGDFIKRRTAGIKIPKPQGGKDTLIVILIMLNVFLTLSILYGFHLGR